MKISSVRFRNFKALRDFSVSLDRVNVLVGPNNAGKSTILSAFRALRRLARRGSAVDALVVAFAEPGGTVLTSHPDDLEALASHPRDVTIVRPGAVRRPGRPVPFNPHWIAA